MKSNYQQLSLDELEEEIKKEFEKYLKKRGYHNLIRKINGKRFLENSLIKNKDLLERNEESQYVLYCENKKNDHKLQKISLALRTIIALQFLEKKLDNVPLNETIKNLENNFKYICNLNGYHPYEGNIKRLDIDKILYRDAKQSYVIYLYKFYVMKFKRIEGYDIAAENEKNECLTSIKKYMLCLKKNCLSRIEAAKFLYENS